jgi:hypothetical protein
MCSQQSSGYHVVPYINGKVLKHRAQVLHPKPANTAKMVIILPSLGAFLLSVWR